jgi:lipopolysaccharide/colanic/teichoic acid biosynthesis glycosyltransferase
MVAVGSKGNVFFRQVRVGKNNRDFSIIKFRTMVPGSDKSGLLTAGDQDSRITRVGRFLRKYKLDELPQLFNILDGKMSLVGPRPEVRKYVDMYNEQQKNVLKVKPGLTDYASLEYFSEGELLATHENPEKYYVEVIMPAKLKLNLKYIKQSNLLTDLKIIFRTLSKIVGGN